MQKILVVEDELDTRKIIVDYLDQSGYNAIGMNDGAEALNYISSEIPDLIISDLKLPNVDGFQLLQRMSDQSLTDLIPVIILSAYCEHENIRKIISLGAEDFLPKPFRINDLKKSIDLHLKKKNRYKSRIEKIYRNISASLSHELLTPIIPIVGYPQILVEDYDSYSKEQIINVFGIIKKSGDRLHKTIRKFLKYSELVIKEDDQLSRMEENEETTLISSNLINLWKKSICDEKRLSDLFVDLEAGEICIDPIDLEFIIVELIDNFIKSSITGQQIIISGNYFESNYVLSISDSGERLNTNQLNWIDSIFSDSTSKYQQKSFELGLITVHKLIEYYQCQIKFKKDEQQRTTVSIILKSKTNPTFEKQI